MSTTTPVAKSHPKIVHDDFAFGPPGTGVVADFTTREGVYAACSGGFSIAVHNGKAFAAVKGGIVTVTLPEATQSCEFLVYQGAGAARGRVLDDHGAELARFVVPTRAAGSRLERVSFASRLPLRRVEFEWPSGEGGLDSITFLVLHVNDKMDDGVDVAIASLLADVSVLGPRPKVGGTDLVITDPIAPLTAR